MGLPPHCSGKSAQLKQAWGRGNMLDSDDIFQEAELCCVTNQIDRAV